MRIIPYIVTIADWHSLAALHRQCFEHGWDADAIREMVAIPGTILALVEAEGGVAGFGVARTLVGEAEILTLAVESARRSQGIGRALLDALVAQAAKDGALLVFLDVAEDNAPALHLYEAAGFLPLSRRKGYYRRAGGLDADAVVLRKIL